MQLNGKEYTAKRVNLLTLKKVQAIEKKMADLDKTLDTVTDFDKYDSEYSKLWLQKCALMVEGDVSGLAITEITPYQVGELESFFLSVFMDGVPQSVKTSSGT